MKLIKTVKPLIALLFGTLVLSGCGAESYPPEVKTDLVSLCMEGILSGQTNVIDKDGKKPSAADFLKLCEFRYGEFIKEVPLADYLAQQTHLYESFQRAYRQKYVLEDVYNSLSPKDKETFAITSKVMLGLETEEVEQ